MPSPIVSDDIPEYNAQASVCDKLELLFRTSDRFKTLLGYMFDSGGNVSTDFATDIANAIGSIIGVPVGSVVWRPVSTVPNGYVIANGQSLSRDTYADLFAVYGTNFGSDSSTTFKVPNLYDKFLIGGGNTYPVQSTGGSQTVTLTAAQVPPHTHTITDLQARTTAGSNADCLNSPLNPTTAGTFPDITTDDGTSGGLNGEAHDNIPPYMAGLWLVKT